MNAPDPQDDPPQLNELPPSDEALMELVKAQDVGAFSLLFDRYACLVYVMAAHLVGQTEAEEIVQEVFWRIWHRAPQFEPTRGSARGWLMAIARTLVHDALKRRNQEQRFKAKFLSA